MPAPSRSTGAALAQLVISTAILGAGVSLLLGADLGADGFAMLIDGTSKALGIEFVWANAGVSVLFVAFAWWRGTKPGWGTIALPIVVGSVVSLLDGVTPQPASLGGRITEFVIAFAVVCAGVAGYLAADLGAGPAEAAAVAVDPPIPFKWSYNTIQLVGAGIGWLCGATIGIGTIVVVVLIGPCVDRLVPMLRLHPNHREPSHA